MISNIVEASDRTPILLMPNSGQVHVKQDNYLHSQITTI